MLEKSEGTIRNEQSRDTGNFGHKTRNETNKRRRRKENVIQITCQWTNIKIYKIIINRSQSIKPRISYNVENFFFLKCMTTMPGWIYIYSFLFSVHLIKCKAKKKKHHAVETFQKSNILNDIEQLLEHTQVSKQSIGFKWRNRGCIVRFLRLLSLLYTDDNIIFIIFY